MSNTNNSSKQPASSIGGFSPSSCSVATPDYVEGKSLPSRGRRLRIAARRAPPGPGAVQRRERLGGLLSFYFGDAA
jgi:hypothetical protein